MEEKENKQFQRGEKGREMERKLRCSFLPVTSGKREEGRREEGKACQNEVRENLSPLSGVWVDGSNQLNWLFNVCLLRLSNNTLFLSFPPYPIASLTQLVFAFSLISLFYNS